MGEFPAMRDAVVAFVGEVSSLVDVMYQFARLRGHIWLPDPGPSKNSSETDRAS